MTVFWHAKQFSIFFPLCVVILDGIEREQNMHICIMHLYSVVGITTPYTARLDIYVLFKPNVKLTFYIKENSKQSAQTYHGNTSDCVHQCNFVAFSMFIRS